MQDLSGELESTKAERRSLLCESQKFTEEKEELLRRVMSLKEDKQQLGAQLNEEKEKVYFDHAELSCHRFGSPGLTVSSYSCRFGTCSRS